MRAKLPYPENFIVAIFGEPKELNDDQIAALESTCSNEPWSILLWRYKDHLTNAQIASRLGGDMSASSVQTKIQKLLRRLNERQDTCIWCGIEGSETYRAYKENEKYVEAYRLLQALQLDRYLKRLADIAKEHPDAYSAAVANYRLNHSDSFICIPFAPKAECHIIEHDGMQYWRRADQKEEKNEN